MKIRIVALFALIATALSVFTALPAEARMAGSSTSVEDPTDSLGLIITYKPGFSLTAPNGEPTAINFTGLLFEKPEPITADTQSIDFARDYSNEEKTNAINNLRLAPQVKSVEFNKYVQSTDYRPSNPVASLLAKPSDFITMPIVVRSAIKLASLSTGTARDWLDPNNLTAERVKLTWGTPRSGYSGTLIGFRVQVLGGGVWRTLASQLPKATRSYVSNSGYLRAGTQAKFRVAPITTKYSKKYVGSWKTISITPTTAPKYNSSRLTLSVTSGALTFSWDQISTGLLSGGMEITDYRPILTANNSRLNCAPVPNSNSCQVSSPPANKNYLGILGVVNSNGTTYLYQNSSAVNYSDDSRFSQQWSLTNVAGGMNVQNAWAIESGLPSVVVAVLDTGITNHEDLPDSKIIPGYDFVSDLSGGYDTGDWCTGDPNCEPKSSWHGTHVAGIIAAADNYAGIVGVAPNVSILPVRVLGPTGGDSSTILKGLAWAAGLDVSNVSTNPNPAHVINMSIGSSGTTLCDDFSQSLMTQIMGLGITIVTAAGNSAVSAGNSWPTNCLGPITVGSVGKTGRPAFYSNYNDDLSAPGGDDCYLGRSQDNSGMILSDVNGGEHSPTPANNNYALMEGTSMASPAVAGVVALMYSAAIRRNPNVSEYLFHSGHSAFVNSLYDSLSGTLKPFASMRPNYGTCTDNYQINRTPVGAKYGAGIVDAYAALESFINVIPTL